MIGYESVRFPILGAMNMIKIEHQFIEYKRTNKEPQKAKPPAPAADLGETLRRLPSEREYFNISAELARLREEREGLEDEDDEDEDASNEDDESNGERDEEEEDNENDEDENGEESDEEEETIAELPRHYIDGRRLNPNPFHSRVLMFAAQEPLAGMDSPTFVIQSQYPTFDISPREWYYNRWLLGNEANVITANADRNRYRNASEEEGPIGNDPAYQLWNRMRLAGYVTSGDHPTNQNIPQQIIDPLDQLRVRALPGMQLPAGNPSTQNQQNQYSPIGQYYSPSRYQSANTTGETYTYTRYLMNPNSGEMYSVTYPLFQWGPGPLQAAPPMGAPEYQTLDPNTAYPTSGNQFNYADSDNLSYSTENTEYYESESDSLPESYQPSSERLPNTPWQIFQVSSEESGTGVWSSSSYPAQDYPTCSCRTCAACQPCACQPCAFQPCAFQPCACEQCACSQQQCSLFADEDATARGLLTGREYTTFSPSGHAVPRSWYTQTYLAWQQTAGQSPNQYEPNGQAVAGSVYEQQPYLTSDTDTIAPTELANGQPHLRGPYEPLLAHRLANAVEYGLFTADDDGPDSMMANDVLDQIIRLRPNFMEPNNASGNNVQNQMTASPFSPLDQREANAREEQKMLWDISQRRGK